MQGGDKNLNILRKKKGFKVNLKAFFIIFKEGFSLTRVISDLRMRSQKVWTINCLPFLKTDIIIFFKNYADNAAGRLVSNLFLFSVF